MADAQNAAPAAPTALEVANRVHDLAALLSCVADRVAVVHGSMEADHEESLWQALRAIRHCQWLASVAADEVENLEHLQEARHG